MCVGIQKALHSGKELFPTVGLCVSFWSGQAGLQGSWLHLAHRLQSLEAKGI